jgi:hypothetical protein
MMTSLFFHIVLIIHDWKSSFANAPSIAPTYSTIIPESGIDYKFYLPIYNESIVKQSTASTLSSVIASSSLFIAASSPEYGKSLDSICSS